MKKGSFDCAGRKPREREVIAPRTAAFLYIYTNVVPAEYNFIASNVFYATPWP